MIGTHLLVPNTAFVINGLTTAADILFYFGPGTNTILELEYGTNAGNTLCPSKRTCNLRMLNSREGSDLVKKLACDLRRKHAISSHFS